MEEVWAEGKVLVRESEDRSRSDQMSVKSAVTVQGDILNVGKIRLMRITDSISTD